ncbi:tRNA (mnm(5)s(2)U34)-methyltransferase [Streptococcus merionis]|uniref:Methyltransferase n=1 Tax=Streptococcus merionis TaxID=400065 RepID=A0A239SUI6_9STRE|nr:class I SAM-dependent methyltransferase [Streptococcus merionis]SNU89151.1 methyltransferase [Streptococcus merionis]
MLRPLHMAHAFLEEILMPDAVAIDATMGNGHDTLFLAQRAGRVLAFDIQQAALDTTQRRLLEAGFENVELILAGHETVSQHVSSAKVAIFNLGYLPSADKSVITQPETTLSAIEQICQLLEVGGRLAIMVYYGHAGGDVERDAVLDFVKTLPQTKFTVAIYQTINQMNNPPFLIMVEKLRET